MLKKLSLIILFSTLCVVSRANAVKPPSLTIQVYEVMAQEKDSIGPLIGTLHFEDTYTGLKITPNLKNLTTGQKGFHIHENGTCESNLGTDKKWVAAGAAGGHLDPKKTHKHLGPDQDGHLGDLRALEVNEQGVANQTVIAPRLTLKDITGHSIIIHKNGDNYSDNPEKLGGGGPRIACGVIK